MKRIRLSQGKFALVDDEDFDWLNQWKWSYHKHPEHSTGYAVRRSNVDGKVKQIKMHQIVCPCGPGYTPDHKDRNGLNNQRDNLRPATQTQQRGNMVRKKRPARSGYRGVARHPSGWTASIGRPPDKYIGLFRTKKAAAMAYNEKAVEKWGEFALLTKVR